MHSALSPNKVDRGTKTCVGSSEGSPATPPFLLCSLVQVTLHITTYMLQISVSALLLCLGYSRSLANHQALWILLLKGLSGLSLSTSLASDNPHPSSACRLIHRLHICRKFLPQHRPDHDNILPTASWWFLSSTDYYSVFSA